MCGSLLWLRSMNPLLKTRYGSFAEAIREKGGGIQMDLQGEACNRKKHGEVQGTLHGKGVFIEGGY